MTPAVVLPSPVQSVLRYQLDHLTSSVPAALRDPEVIASMERSVGFPVGMTVEEVDYWFDWNRALTAAGVEPPGWRVLFVDALTAWYLQSSNPRRVMFTRSSAQHLLGRLDGRSPLPGTELALISNIMALATGAPDFFRSFARTAVGEAMVASVSVLPEHIDFMTRIVYGAAGDEGVATSREEADYLVHLDRALAQRAQDSSWKAFFTEALVWHLLHDRSSPGRIEDEEAGWLMGHLAGGERPAAGNMVAVMKVLKARARSVPDYLQPVFDNLGDVS